jgi:hypothetical protein
MEVVRVFGHLAVIVQLALVIGVVTVICLFAFSRRATKNLVLILRELRFREGYPLRKQDEKEKCDF